MHPARTQPIYTPPGGPGEVPLPSREILPAVGEAGVFALLAKLYEYLEASPLRPMFAADMPAASRRSAAFFVQLLGGPPLYNQAYGPPRMRQRHFPFEIDGQARDLWLAAFDRALEFAQAELGFPSEHVPGFRAFLAGFSGWMVNVAPER
ncbi:MAG TPA: hypothetical protein PLJ12_06690 [Planctomycetota bacterium]|nr:hypothetical protein [Planctomycetota bacterium]